MDASIFLLRDVIANGPGCMHAERDFLHSVYGWGEFDGARLILEVSPDGVEWFILRMMEEKAAFTIQLSAPYLRGRIESAGDATSLSLLLL